MIRALLKEAPPQESMSDPGSYVLYLFCCFASSLARQKNAIDSANICPLLNVSSALCLFWRTLNSLLVFLFLAH